MNYSLEGKDIVFQLYTDSTSVEEGDTIQVTLTASGNDAVPGLKIPYSIIGSVRSSDIKTQTMFGLFELDSSLVARLNIKINKDPYIESTTIPEIKQLQNTSPITTIYPSLYIPSNTTDTIVYAEILTLGLYYKPSIYLDVTIKDNTVIEPDTRITSFPDNSPVFELTPLSNTIKEGNPAIFLIKYRNVIEGFKFTYSSYDTVTENIVQDYFYTDSSGYAYLTIQTIITNTTSRQLSITLDRYPEITSTIQINTAKIDGLNSPLIGGRKYIAPYSDSSIVIPYGRSLKFHIIGGGGAGGDVAKSGGTDGYNGSTSSVYNAAYGNFKAMGGQAGQNNGLGGAGGNIDITEPSDGSITYQVIESNQGQATDVYPNLDTQPGGKSVAGDANTDNDGTGGIGSKGMGTAQRQATKRRWYGAVVHYTETYQTTVYGRGGGSGAYLCIILTNNSSTDIPFILSAGAGGINSANSDLKGTDGCIIIEDA